MAEVSKETQLSIEASSMFPGFRFSPTDVELISYYLKKKMEGDDKCVEVISEVEICKHEPWDLPGKSVIKSDNEWFFFSARGRKYPNGSQSRRATELGYWKATGKERNVKSGSNLIGTKRTLVFHIGRAPKGERTEWIMHEYCMHGKSQDSLVVCRLRRNVEFRVSENSNRTVKNARQLSKSEGGTDQTVISEADKAVECSRKCSYSSHDSHSFEQFDSASESEQKLSNEAPLAESSCHQQEDSDNEDDFYADILKDDIVKLDETSLSVKADMPKSETQAAAAQQTVELIMSQLQLQQQQQQQQQQQLPSQSIPSQGTANRRIKLKMQTDQDHAEGSSKEPPKCVLGIHIHKLVSLILVILTLLVLILSFKDGPQHVKRFMYANSSKSFWH